MPTKSVYELRQLLRLLNVSHNQLHHDVVNLEGKVLSKAIFTGSNYNYPDHRKSLLDRIYDINDNIRKIEDRVPNDI
jgi:hypothetical protein